MTVKPEPALQCFSILLFVLFIAPGCGCKNSAGDGESTNGDEEPQGPFERDADLDLLGDYGPPIDGLVKVAPPKDWKTQQRRSPYLVRFTGSAARINPLPRIRITAGPSNFDAPHLTKENLLDFLVHVEANLKESRKEASLLEPPVTMIIGGRPCVRYVLAGRLRLPSNKTRPVETQRLVTVVSGKQYQIDLQVVEGAIPASRDRSYAVFAGMKFLQTAGDSKPAPSKQDDESAVDGTKVDDAHRE